MRLAMAADSKISYFTLGKMAASERVYFGFGCLVVPNCNFSSAPPRAAYAIICMKVHIYSKTSLVVLGNFILWRMSLSMPCFIEAYQGLPEVYYVCALFEDFFRNVHMCTFHKI